MKALHVISSAGMYGAEAVVLALLRELGSHGALAVFDNRSNPNLALHRAAAAAGLESYTLPCAGQMDRSTVAALRTLAGQCGADLVHAHGYKADVYAAFAAGGSPWPMLSTCHTWHDTDLIGRVYGAVDRWMLRRAAAVVAVSAEVEQRLIRSGVPAGRVSLIRNGIDPTPFVSAPRSASTLEPVVGFAARLAPEKGTDLLLEAAQLVLAERPGVLFRLAGDGPERSALVEGIARRGLAGSVTLLGRQEDMPAFYRSVDLLVSPSRSEGLPITLLEAMASGLPVVATPVGDVPTLIEDDVTGLLVPPGDGPALARAVLQLLDDPARRLALGAAAAERVRTEFSARTMARQYTALYEAVLQRTAPQLAGSSR